MEKEFITHFGLLLVLYLHSDSETGAQGPIFIVGTCSK